MIVLGISAFYHDSAAALVIDGVVVAAVQEERFSRIKHDSSFPEKSVIFCIDQANILPEQIDHIVFYEKPLVKFDRLLETCLALVPASLVYFVRVMPIWFKEKIFQKRVLIKKLTSLFGNDIEWSKRISFSEHHMSHAASAFFPSPFEDAAVLTLDAVGEWATTSIAVGSGQSLKVREEILFPHSVGLLYSSFTYYLGFKVNSGEYKVMGLAPYGTPIFSDMILSSLITVGANGSFRLNMNYFGFLNGFEMINKKFEALFKRRRREPESEVEQFHMDVAASIQKVTEELVVSIATYISTQYSAKNLCLAGGVALNCVANGVLSRAKIFEQIWVQPAAGDAGGALGAALALSHIVFKTPRPHTISQKDGMLGAFLGPEYSDQEIEIVLRENGAVFDQIDETKMTEAVASLLERGLVVGWFQGRAEFGPRALGARSILADPRPASMQTDINLKIKFREGFRPFAPSILAAESFNWFDLEHESPYMLFVGRVKGDKLTADANSDGKRGFEALSVVRSVIPAVTHVDSTARVQTVKHETNPKFFNLIEEFFKRTGCPILVNTSFNVRGEPMVASPADAFRCFMGTELDALAIGNFLLLKDCQTSDRNTTYHSEYELD